MKGVPLRSRRSAVIALIVAVELARAGLANGVAGASPGLIRLVTVSVEGATGTWPPAQSTGAEPAATVVADPAATPPAPTDQ